VDPRPWRAYRRPVIRATRQPSTLGRVRRFATVLAVVAAVSGPRAVAQSATRTARYERVGTFENRLIRESSGVAVSRRGGGYLWTHNDSSDEPVLYLTDLRGFDRGMVWLRGASAVDWEDLAAGPCPGMTDKSCLYVGDVGNNLKHREWIDIYVVEEPAVLASGRDTLDVLKHLRVRFPDRPRDTEAVAVGADGTLWLFPKGPGPTDVFRIPPAAFDHDTVTAIPAGDLGFLQVNVLGRVLTGAAISADGRRMVARTYTELYFFRMGSDGTWSRDGSPCWLGLADGQGEGVDFWADDQVVLTAEGLGVGTGRIGLARCDGEP